MDIHIEVVTINEKMMTLLVVREGVMDWILTPIYASPKSSFWNAFVEVSFDPWDHILKLLGWSLVTQTNHWRRKRKELGEK